MKLHHRILAAAALLAVSAGPAQADVDQLLSDVARATAGSMAIVQCTFAEDSATPAVVGLAVCIDPSGEFMSLAFNSGMNNAAVKECKLLPAGGGKLLEAKLERIDRGTGIAFLRCTDPAAPKWSAVKFVQQKGPLPGQRVVSASILPGDPAGTPYYGSAVVSTVLRAPQKIVYVTGGKLTRVGSPVFAQADQAIGLVWRQLPEDFDISTGGRRANASLQSRQESRFFTPTDEFMHTLSRRKGEAKLAWAGIARFQPVNAEMFKLDHPGVRITNIIPDQPAAKAGLKEMDVIVQVNGEYLEELATPTLTTVNLERVLLRMPVGTKVTFTLENGNKVPVTLEPMPTRPFEAKRYINRKLGLIVREKVLLDTYLSPSPSAKTMGLLVTLSAKDSPADKARLRRGDVVTSANAQPVRTTDTFKQIVDKAVSSGAESLSLLVQRGTEPVPINIPLSR